MIKRFLQGTTGNVDGLSSNVKVSLTSIISRSIVRHDVTLMFLANTVIPVSPWRVQSCRRKIWLGCEPSTSVGVPFQPYSDISGAVECWVLSTLGMV